MPPTFVTGYLYCYDEDGEAEAGVTVAVRLVGVVGEGAAFDTKPRTATSDGTGLVQFTNMPTGASYLIRRGTTGDWKSISIPQAATSPYALPNISGKP